MDAATLDAIYKHGCLVSHAHGLQAVFDAGVASTVTAVVDEPEAAPVAKAARAPKKAKPATKARKKK